MNKKSRNIIRENIRLENCYVVWLCCTNEVSFQCVQDIYMTGRARYLLQKIDLIETFSVMIAWFGGADSKGGILVFLNMELVYIL